MRLFLCVSCVLGFAGLSTLKADDTGTPSAVMPVTTISPTGLTSPSAVLQASPTASTKDTLQPTTGLPTAEKPSGNLPSSTSVPQAPSTPVPILTKSVSDPGSHGNSLSGPTVSVPSKTSRTSPSTSVSGPQPSPTTAALTSLEPTKESKSISVSAIPSGSTVVASSSSQSTRVASLDTETTKTPGFLVVDQGQSTTAGSGIPGSTTKQITIDVLPEGSVLTAGPTLSQEKSTYKGAVTETSSDATTTAKGAELPEKPSGDTRTTHSSPVVSSTATHLSPVVISTAAKTARAPTGEVPHISSSPTTPQASDSSPSVGPVTQIFPGIKLTCFQQDLSNKSLILLTQEQKTTLCNDNTLMDQTKLLAVLCETAKPGFKFSEKKDNCTVQLGYNKKHPYKVAVLEVSVQTNAVAEDINTILKGKTEELKKLGFLIDNNPGGGKVPPEEYEDRISIPLIITIVCLAAALLLIAAIYSCCHQRQRHKKDQRLTEELQTMENGYHDNPTLEVMETSPEMQEKKAGLNGDLGDSWIVPLDNLTKEDLDDEEEDTHL